MSAYNVPEDWKPVYTASSYKGDFIGEPDGQYQWPIGWLTPDGFVSPDKLPDQFRVKLDKSLLDADGSADNLKGSNSTQLKRITQLEAQLEAERAKTAAAVEVLQKIANYRGVMAGGTIPTHSQTSLARNMLADLTASAEAYTEQVRREEWDRIFHQLIPLIQVKIKSYPKANNPKDEGMDIGMYSMLNFISLFAEKSIPKDELAHLISAIEALKAESETV